MRRTCPHCGSNRCFAPMEPTPPHDQSGPFVCEDCGWEEGLYDDPNEDDIRTVVRMLRALV